MDSKVEYMRVVKYFLKINGMYPINENANLPKKIFFYFWRFMCLYLLISTMIQLIISFSLKTDVTLLNSAGYIMNVVIYFASTIRTIYYYIYSKEVKEIMDEMNYYFINESYEGESKLSMNKTRKTLEFFSAGWYFNCCLVTQLSIIPAFISRSPESTLNVDAWYPCDWKISPCYEYVFLTQTVTQFLMTVMFNDADLFFSASMVLTGKQFDVLAHNFKNLYFDELLKENFSKDQVLNFFNNVYEINYKKRGESFGQIHQVIQSKNFNDKIEDKLKNWIKHHQRILAFCEKLQKFFSPILALSLFYGIFYLIFIGFCSIIAQNLSFAQYLSTGTIEILIITYSGEYLTDKVNSFRTILFEMPWYIASEKVKRIYRIIQIRTGREIIISASGIADVGLRTFIGIIRICISYFTVLQQMAMGKEEK